MATLELSNWYQGHITPWWGLQHQTLPYVNEPFNDTESLAEWKKLGYTQSRFTGDMYDMRNIEPGWINAFRQHFQWQHFSWSVYRMDPGCVLPQHHDTYDRFIKIYNIADPTKICRAIVFLEDWAPGHYFDVMQTPIVNWRAGDTVTWNWNTPHTAANVGLTPRYTLQITGIFNDNFVL
jgi:hypothetical protein